MNDVGITFSWPWFWATVLGAFIGFVVGEMMERILPNVWAKVRRSGWELRKKMQKTNFVWQKRSETKVSSNLPIFKSLPTLQREERQ